MYTCGPTVHNFAHLGNFRAYIFEDLLRRTLKYFGYRVIQVMNLTDVEDKTIHASNELGIKLSEYTKKYKDSFFEDWDILRIERAEYYPAATEHIPEMVDLIQRLIKAGHTYEVDGSVYFRISSFSDYGKLANVQPDKLKTGLRVDSDEYEKEDVRDFALWKAWTPQDGEVFWDTPLGRGRPGWHIECSAMSTKYLGTHFDIHTGGVDNMFPHHENEIAQSVCGYGDKFVNLWMHNAHLIINGEKMSKSLGNFYTLRDIISYGNSPRVIRYFLMSAHYRQLLNLIFDPVTGDKGSFENAKGALDRIDEFRVKLAEIKKRKTNDSIDPAVTKILGKASAAFEGALANDLDISGALGAVFSMIKDVNRLLASNDISSRDADLIEEKLKDWDRVLDVISPDKEESFDEARIDELVEERNRARREKDFARSDEIRDQLASEGIIIQDTADGTRWRKK